MDARGAGSSSEKDDTSPSQECLHRRMLDDERTPDGRKTGNLICVECGAVIPDPTATRRDG